MDSQIIKFPEHAMLLDPSFGIPTDVTFQIMECSANVNGVNLAEEVVVGEVKGHKLILGLFSQVFKNQFFGEAKDTKEIIPIRQTTREAFERMIDHIYSKPIDWSAMNIVELYDVVNLAEKYHMSPLMEVAKSKLETFPLTIENLMEVASTADEYQQFPSVTSAVLLSCAKFLKSSLQSREDLFRFAAEQVERGQEATAIKLHALAHGLAVDQPPQLCVNCHEVRNDCLDGQEVKSVDKVTPGCKLSPNKDCLYWANTDGRSFTVITVYPDEQKVKVHSIDIMAPNGVADYNFKWSNVQMFVFSCK